MLKLDTPDDGPFDLEIAVPNRKVHIARRLDPSATPFVGVSLHDVTLRMVARKSAFGYA
jgi:hypothetical protein